MARRIWKGLPGGRSKRWKSSGGGCIWAGIPPRWYRNMLNRKERRRMRSAVRQGEPHRFAYVHPRCAGWYW
jgi:hypothetical protein